MPEAVSSAAQKIRNLEVQGVKNVAIAAINAMETIASETETRTKQDFIKELLEAKEILFASRETEPLMRNSVRWIINQVEKSDEKKVKDLAKTVSSASEQFLKSLEKSKEKIAEIGAKRIRGNSAIFTHCHFSTVTYLLKRAKREGKSFEIICTETRPVFQGRITAREM